MAAFLPPRTPGRPPFRAGSPAASFLGAAIAAVLFLSCTYHARSDYLPQAASGTPQAAGVSSSADGPQIEAAVLGHIEFVSLPGFDFGRPDGKYALLLRFESDRPIAEVKIDSAVVEDGTGRLQLGGLCRQLGMFYKNSRQVILIGCGTDIPLPDTTRALRLQCGGKYAFEDGEVRDLSLERQLYRKETGRFGGP